MDHNQEVAKMLDAMFAAWNRSDLETYTGFWSEDADLVNVLGVWRKGRAEILAELEFLHAGRFRGTQIRKLDHTVRFLASEIAVVRVQWDMRWPAEGSDKNLRNATRHGLFIHVVVRTSGGWRLVASQNTEIQVIPDDVDARPEARTEELVPSTN